MPGNRKSTLEQFAAACIAAAALACALLPAETLADDGQPPAGAPAKKARLDLSLGDLSRYLDPAEMAMPLPNELEEIIVRGRKPPKLPEQRIIPMGLGSLVYAAKNPLQSWRILVPDPNVKVPLRDPDEVRDPPGAFRGRILAPGRIYD